MEIHEIIRRPLLTEKGTMLKEMGGQYLFEVNRRSSKFQIKRAVEKLFNVKVKDVHTVNIRGKIKRVGKNIGQQPNWKKAYVTLEKGTKIEFFEGV
jgi:large subunit ribosomal protein L23